MGGICISSFVGCPCTDTFVGSFTDVDKSGVRYHWQFDDNGNVKGTIAVNATWENGFPRDSGQVIERYFDINGYLVADCNGTYKDGYYDGTVNYWSYYDNLVYGQSDSTPIKNTSIAYAKDGKYVRLNRGFEDFFPNSEVDRSSYIVSA